MELSKADCISLIKKRFNKLASSIAELDSAISKKAATEADTARLRTVEADIIAKDESKPDALVLHRAKIDLATGKLARAAKAVLIVGRSCCAGG